MLAIFKTPRTGRPDNRDAGNTGNTRNDRAGAYPPRMTPPPPKPSPVSPPPVKAPASNTTIIGKGLDFNGEVRGEGSVRVEGKFVGTLNIGNEVIIGDGGVVEGNIRAKHVSVLGTLRGNVTALDKITIDVTGAMYGDIVAPRVVVAEGAVYKGKIDMEPKTVKSHGGDKSKESGQKKDAGEAAGKKAGKAVNQNKVPGPPPKA